MCRASLTDRAQCKGSAPATLGICNLGRTLHAAGTKADDGFSARAALRFNHLPGRSLHGSPTMHNDAAQITQKSRTLPATEFYARVLGKGIVRTQYTSVMAELQAPLFAGEDSANLRPPFQLGQAYKAPGFRRGHSFSSRKRYLSADRYTGLHIRRTNRQDGSPGDDQFDPEAVLVPEIRSLARVA